jgi:hypothetical protein
LPGGSGTMRRLMVMAAAVALLSGAGCKRKVKPNVAATEEGAGELATVIQTGDPKVASQLLKGFYSVEGGAWRWTMQKFTVSLRTPARAATAGATLAVHFALPEAVIQKLKTVSLTAAINGKALPAKSYDKPGDQVYEAAVPPELLKSSAVTVEFTLDKAMAPGTLDQRELGIVVSSIGFEPK